MTFGNASRLLPCLLMIAAATSSGPAAAKVSDKTSYKHYTVNGDTPSAIIIDMYKKRRISGRDFTIATIETKVKPGGEMVPGKTCRIKDFSLHSTHVITLPRHRNERRLRGRTRKLFRSFVANARKHELKHRAIYRGCMRRLHRAVQSMRRFSSCDAALREITRLSKIEGKRCKAEHAAFDRREYAVSQKMPLLREAIRDVKALKAARISKAQAARALAGDSGSFGAAKILLRRERSWKD